MGSHSRLSWTKLLVFSLLPLVVILVLLETFFRLLPENRDQAAIDGLVMPDDELIWRLKPISRGPLKTNQIGFRDLPFRGDAGKKVLLLGDSVAWGDQVREVGLVFPQRLETLLGEREGEDRFEVINSAVPGYSTFQQLRYLTLEGLDLQPDLIILQFCLNDVIERYSSLAQYGGDNIFQGIDTRQAMTGVYGWLTRNSRAFEKLSRFLVKAARDFQEYDVRKLADAPLSEELEEAWKVTLEEMDGIRSIAHENGIPLLLVIPPYRFQLENPQALDQPQRRLLQYAGESGMPAVDLLPAFSKYRAIYPQRPLFLDANHFSPLGHELTARELIGPVLSTLGERTPHGEPGT